MKLAFADRDRYYGDPKFSEIPEQTLLSKEYGARAAQAVDQEHASMESRPGELGRHVPMPTSERLIGGSSDTTCVNVVDH